MTTSKRSSRNTEKPIPGSCRNTRRPNLRFKLSAFVLLAALAAGCGPKHTYPGAVAAQSVEDICQNEFNLTVEARIAGKTLGALIYVDKILDERGQLLAEAQEQMGRVMQSVTRVALSTDRPIQFCTVLMREKNTGIQIFMTRSLDDTKRAYAEALGIEESINRTVFGQGQFDPANATFVLKDIPLAEFLADQIVQRIRINFAKEASHDGERMIEDQLMAEGIFGSFEGKKVFRFSTLSFRAGDPHRSILMTFRAVNDALEGYRFSDFDEIEIQDYLNRQRLNIDRKTLEDFQAKKITEEELLNKCLSESQSIQEAFKLFGFSAPPDQAITSPAPDPVR